MRKSRRRASDNDSWLRLDRITEDMARMVTQVPALFNELKAKMNKSQTPPEGGA